MELTQLEPIEPNKNPFIDDVSNMGTRIASNVMVMHHTHGNEYARYIIIIDLTTGERMSVHFEPEVK